MDFQARHEGDAVNLQIQIETPDVSLLDTLPVVIMDIDGTLANAEHRVHLISDWSPDGLLQSKNWPEFLARAVDDTVNEEIRALNNAMYGIAQIFVVTGRSEDSRDMTVAWLKKHGITYDRLYMRPTGDYREDCQVKSEVLDQILAEDRKILFAVEDRKRVTAMWRARGVRCLQVAEGDY